MSKNKKKPLKLIRGFIWKERFRPT
jgi:hypothetical protein